MTNARSPERRAGRADTLARCTRAELITAEPAEALAGLLDIAAPAANGGALPPLWHWIYLLDRPRQSELGEDGHPVQGIPAPPAPGLLRMFAGGRVTTYRPLRFGETATRTARVHRSIDKTGRSGRLTFVTVRAEITQGGRLAIVDEQDIMYRRGPAPGDPGAGVDRTAGAGQATAVDRATAADRTEPASSVARLDLEVDPVLLFRFSALTYNAHRIHYDLGYTTRAGYPDLVVHGPLQALLMGEAMRRAGAPLLGRRFTYRLVAPAYGTQRLSATVATDGPDLSARVRDGRGVVTAIGTLAGAIDDQPATG